MAFSDDHAQHCIHTCNNSPMTFYSHISQLRDDTWRAPNEYSFEIMLSREVANATHPYLNNVLGGLVFLNERNMKHFGERLQLRAY